MLAAFPFQSTNPGSWSWIVYLWLALLARAGLPALWRWFQRRRAATWPAADGRIEQTTTDGANAAELLYSYSVAGTTYGGFYRREFSTEPGAKSFVRDLRGRTVAVRYSPCRPSQSMLLEPDIEPVLLNRAPAIDDEPAAPTSIPDWSKPFIWVFVWLSVIGLVLSLWVHVGALMGHDAPSMPLWILHAGVFVVWIPAVSVAWLAGGANRKDLKDLLRGSPDWMRYIVYGFFAYAMANFTIFIAQAPRGGSGANPSPLVWRGFSGHWMAFYSASLAILYSAANATDSSHR